MSVLEFNADVDYVTDNGADPIEQVWVRNDEDGSYEAFFPSSAVSGLKLKNHDLRCENAMLLGALRSLRNDKPDDVILLLERENARLRAKMEEWARLFEDNARDNGQYGSWMEAEDWYEYAHDMRIDMLSPDAIEKVQV